MRKGMQLFGAFIVLIFTVTIFSGCGGGGGGSASGESGSGSIDQDCAQRIGVTGVQASQSCMSLGMVGASTSPSGPRKEDQGDEEGPPDTFFTTDILTDATDGYVSIDADFNGQDIKIRLITKGGEYVDAEYLTGKQLGLLDDYDWKTFFLGQIPTQEQREYFTENQTYQQITCLGEYLIWSYLAPEWIDPYMPEGSPPLSNPEPEDTDLVGGMQGVITIQDEDATSQYTLQITVDEDGKPTSASGSGTVTENGVTVTTTMEMAFNDNGYPESITVTGTTSDGYSFTITCNVDGTGTGYIYDASGNQVATITINAGGSGTVTDNNGHTYTFTVY